MPLTIGDLQVKIGADFKQLKQAERGLLQLKSTLGGAERAASQMQVAQKRLDDALRAGIIDEKEFNRLLALTSRRFTTASVNAADLRLNMKRLADGSLVARGRLAGLAAAATGGVAAFGVLRSKLLGVVGAGLALRGLVQTSRTFEDALSDLSAITGATGKNLEFFKNQALALGETTTKSATQILTAFKLIGSAKPELLGTAAALVAVGKAAVTLSEASRLSVPDSANALTTALNQFSAGADQAGRFVNVLAAGSKLGAAEIPALVTALQKAGAVAAGAGTSFEDFIAIVERLAQFKEPIERQATALRNIFIILQTGADATNPKIVGTFKALKNLAAQNLTAAEITKRFGRENFTTATELLRVFSSANKLSKAITGTNVAEEQAKTQTENLGGSLDRLSNTWEELKLNITESNGVLKFFVDLARGSLSVLNQVFTGTDKFSRSRGFIPQTVGPPPRTPGDITVPIPSGIVPIPVTAKRLDTSKLETFVKTQQKAQEQFVKQVRSELLTSLDLYTAKVKKLKKALADGKLTQTEFNKAMAQTSKAFDGPKKAVDKLVKSLKAQANAVHLTERQLFINAQTAKVNTEALREMGLTAAQVADQVQRVSDAAGMAFDVKAAAQQSQALFQSISDSVGQAFDQVGQSLVDAIIKGEGEAIKLRSIFKSLAASLATSFVQLAAINPLRNALFGSMLPVLGGALAGFSPGKLATAGAIGAGGALGGVKGAALGAGVAGLFGSNILFNLGNTLAGAGANIGFSLGGPGLGQALGNVGAGAPFAFAGSGLASLLGLGGGLGGTAGGTVGGGIGFALGGPLGAGIGGFLGSAIGGLFGKSTTLQLQTSALNSMARFEDMISQNTPFGQVGFARSSEIKKEQTPDLVGTLARIDQTLASVLDTTQVGRAASALQAQGTGPSLKFNAKNFGEKLFLAVKDRLSTILGAAFESPGIGGNALNQITPSSQNLDALVQAATDVVNFQKVLDQITGENKPLSQAEQALKNINDQFDELASQAAKLGFAETKVEAARKASIASLTGDFTKNITLSILQLTDPLQAALQELKTTQDQRIKDAKALGVSLVDVERLNGLERQKVVEQFAMQTTTAISQLLDQLLAGPTSPLPLQTVLANAQSRFDMLKNAAQGGDTAALADVATAAQDLLAVSRDAFGSSSGFFDVFDSVVGTLQALSAPQVMDANAKSDGLLQTIGSEVAISGVNIVNAIQDTTAVLMDTLDMLREGKDQAQLVGSLPQVTTTDGSAPSLPFNLAHAPF